MEKSKQNVYIIIIVVLLILLVASIFIIFKNNSVERDELNSELTNQMSDSLETNIVDEDTSAENTAIDNQTTTSENKTSSSVKLSKEEQTKIEQYIDILCNRPNCCRLPEFNNIANADKDWIYLHVDREKYEQYATEQEILESIQDVFGKNISVDIKADQKNIPTDRFSGIPWPANEEGKCLLPIWGDTLVFLYTINDIKKENDKYVVNVIEYCDDLVDGDPYQRAVYSFRENAENKLIFKFEDQQDKKDSKVIEKVLQNKDKFPSFDVVLKNDNGKLIVESIKKN